MKTHIYVIALMAGLLMGACISFGQEEKDGLKTLHVEVDNIRSDVRLSEFAEAKIIPLPTSDDLLIGNISRIRSSGKSICISDENGIFRFSHTGKISWSWNRRYCMFLLQSESRCPEKWFHVPGRDHL